MRRLRLPSIKILVALLLALSASLPSLAATVSWFCDGRLCGTSICCCDQPDLTKNDANCRKIENTQNQPSICEAECGCTPVLSSVAEQHSTLTTMVQLPMPVFAALPPTVSLLIPAYSPVIRAYVPDYRGPPTASITLLSVSLRAPPAS